MKPAKFVLVIILVGALTPCLALHVSGVGPVIWGDCWDASQVSANHVLYELVEPTLGIATGWEIGAHLQETVRPTGPDWGGARLRTMAILPTRDDLPLAFALSLEGGYTPPEYGPATWDLEIRPVAELRLPGLDLYLNPILDVPFDGRSAGVPRFEPAAAVRYMLLRTLDFGAEYYASYGPVSGFDPASRQGQYVFETLELVKWPEWRVRVGLGEGLTEGSNPLALTTIIGHFF